jgi:hypothetical protein
MPDFDTRQPQEAGQEDGAASTRGRVASIANKVRTLLMANKLRAVLVGRILLIVATSMVGLLFLLGGGTDGKGNGVSHQHEASHLSGKMVFAMMGKKGTNIWTMNANGSDLTQLTHSSEYTEKDPNLSPDGTKIAFTNTLEEQDEGDFEYPYLYVIERRWLRLHSPREESSCGASNLVAQRQMDSLLLGNTATILSPPRSWPHLYCEGRWFS